MNKKELRKKMQINKTTIAALDNLKEIGGNAHGFTNEVSLCRTGCDCSVVDYCLS